MIKSLYDTFKPWSATGSIWIISDTHFDDEDTHIMNPNWITPEEHIAILKQYIHKNDTILHLGDVGNPLYIANNFKYTHKVLITGNHDVLSKVGDYFNEVYTGPLFIADRILLSHEPIYGLEDFCLNIHGHVHGGVQGLVRTDKKIPVFTHLNMASDVVKFQPMNMGAIIKMGVLADIPNYHRLTIDNATKRIKEGTYDNQ